MHCNVAVVSAVEPQRFCHARTYLAGCCGMRTTSSRCTMLLYHCQPCCPLLQVRAIACGTRCALALCNLHAFDIVFTTLRSSGGAPRDTETCVLLLHTRLRGIPCRLRNAEWHTQACRAGLPGGACSVLAVWASLPVPGARLLGPQEAISKLKHFTATLDTQSNCTHENASWLPRLCKFRWEQETLLSCAVASTHIEQTIPRQCQSVSSPRATA